MPMFCAANLRLALAGPTMLFSSSAMRFRSARVASNQNHAYTCFKVHVTGLPSHNIFLLRQYTTGLHIASTERSNTSVIVPTPTLCESMPMLSLLSNSIPMRNVSLPCRYRSMPIFAPAYRLPAIQFHRTALPRQHLDLPIPVLPC